MYLLNFFYQFHDAEDSDEEEVIARESINGKRIDVFRSTIMTHNIMAVSKLYTNISLSRLTIICGLPDQEKALSGITDMISRGILAASIDQVVVVNMSN